MAEAAARTVVGRHYTVTADGDPVVQDVRRLIALQRFRDGLRHRALGVVMRIRTPKSVRITARSVSGLDERRARMVRWARWGVAHNPPIHYRQLRPIPQYTPGHLPMYLDCSSSTITFARWAGLPNPAGMAWNAGNSDAILGHLPSISRTSAQPGDLVVFHRGPDAAHVAIVVKSGTNPMLVSHGTESGPRYIQFSAEAAYHAARGRTATFVKVI